MHVLIMGNPRFRTSFLCDAFSKQYNLFNYHETFDFISILSHELHKSKLRKKVDNNEIMTKHIVFLKDQVNKVLDKENSVVKLFPRHIMHSVYENCYYPYSLQNLDQNNFQFVTNFLEILQLDKFDKIITLERNLIESTMSYIFNIFLAEMPLLTSEDHKKIMLKKITKKRSTTILEDKYPLINFYVYEYLIGEKLRSYLKNNYFTEQLTYANSVNYVSSYLPNGAKTRFIATNLDYKDVITNYNQIEIYVQNVYDKLKKELPIEI